MSSPLTSLMQGPLEFRQRWHQLVLPSAPCAIWGFGIVHFVPCIGFGSPIFDPNVYHGRPSHPRSFSERMGKVVASSQRHLDFPLFRLPGNLHGKRKVALESWVNAKTRRVPYMKTLGSTRHPRPTTWGIVERDERRHL